MEVINSLGGWVDNLFPLALKAIKRSKRAGETKNHEGTNEHSPKFFTKGYGDIEFLIESEKKFQSVISGGAKPPTIGEITILEKKECQSLLAGSFISEKWQFESPMSQYLPEESRQVICEFVKPMENNFRAVSIIFPATGDKFFATRRNLISLWLLRHKIASLIIMAPCYGIRKPKGQKGHYNDTVSLYYRSTAALLLEGAVLANHVRESMKVPVVLAGLSFGGAMASGVGLMLDGPIGVVSSVGCPSAKVLATGLLQHEVDWEAIDVEGKGSESAKESLKNFILDRSYEALVDKSEVLKAASARNQAGLRLWCGISAANDAFVHAEEGQALESTMRTLFTVGLEDDDDEEEEKEAEDIPEETLFTACSQKQKHPYHVLPRVEYRIIPGGHATSMLSAPITLVPEIVRMVDRLADYAPMQ